MAIRGILLALILLLPSLIRAQGGGRGEHPPCELASDVNDDKRINVLDPILLLQWLFVEPPAAPPPPWWRCGGDVTDGPLNCLRGCAD